MGIIEDIGAGPICLDSSVFIYFIEENPLYITIVQKIFEAINDGHLVAYTSGITLLETLVIPLRKKDKVLAHQYKKFLTESEGLIVLDLDQDLLYCAAYLRASTGMKTPDALQIAAAQQGGCKIFVTNDRRLPTISDLSIVQLSAYL